MSKLRLLIALVVLTVALSTAAQAIHYYEFVLTDWTPGQGGIPTLYINLDWQSDWTVYPGKTTGADCLRLFGPKPAGDPDVDETITNLSPWTWTDWHVSITNGVIEQAAVQKVGGAAWQVDIEPGGTGFDAYVVPPGGSGEVAPGEQLYIWFRFTAQGGDLIVDEYPTSVYIPEPASVAGLLMGLGAVLGLRRRTKCTLP